MTWADESHRIEAERLAAEVRELREAIASALTSLATGPAKDGYAYAVLSDALAAAPGDTYA